MPTAQYDMYGIPWYVRSGKLCAAQHYGSKCYTSAMGKEKKQVVQYGRRVDGERAAARDKTRQPRPNSEEDKQ